jgi:hypothetical protein
MAARVARVTLSLFKRIFRLRRAVFIFEYIIFSFLYTDLALYLYLFSTPFLRNVVLLFLIKGYISFILI